MDILFLVIGIAVGFAAGFFFSRSRATGSDDGVQQLQNQLNVAERESSILSERVANITAEKTKTETELREERTRLEAANTRLAKAEEAFANQEQRLKTQKEELEQLQQKFTTEFENIANKVLDEKSKKFTEQNKTNLDDILKPLKEKIESFQKKVEDTHEKSSMNSAALVQQIKGLKELNEQMSKEAINLTKALRGDNKKQGNWGELQLERILERSGLIKGQEYDLQVNASDDTGRRFQPDVVIYLPEGKHIIVDAKVSLTAYTEFANCEDEDHRADYLKQHTISLRNHVKGLGDKDYQTLEQFKSPDFVLMFVPSEASFSAAIQSDPDIFNFAWDKKIVIVSPSTLLATLRTIASIWKQERQNKNAVEIAQQSGALYDKFVGFVDDMKSIDKGINNTRKAYDDAMNKLTDGKGNLINRAQKLKELGVKSKKELPEDMLDNDDETPKIASSETPSLLDYNEND